MARTGRPRMFDEQEVVARARDLFWSRGFHATSVQDLVDELSLQRGSLYGAFGDKRSLYLLALSLYARKVRERLEAELASGPVLPALRRVITEPSGPATPPSGESRRGCLIGNTTAELVPGDDDASALVIAAYDQFVRVVGAALLRGQRTGEVSKAIEPDVQAQLMLLLFQGFALVSRAGPARVRMEAAVDAALEAVRCR